MSKEELLKYLIAEIDLIMHDKDYRFENQDGTWYSRESCRDLTNEEVFEELKGELRQLSDIEAKLAESEEKKESYRLQNDDHHLKLLQFYSRLGVEAFGADIHEKALETLMIMKEELKEKNGVERALSACNRQNDEFADMIKKLVSEKEELKQQLAEKDNEIKILDEDRQFKAEMWTKFADKCKDLKQQITEKEKELEAKETLNKIFKDNREDKISFAVEQLEKVKETVECVLDNALKNSSLNQSYYDRLLDEIDNQIKAIKEMK